MDPCFRRDDGRGANRMSITNELAYLFHIKAQNGKEYYLTSANEIITSGRVSYLPYSGLALSSAKFNDSAENHIILHGIFETGGIDKNDELVGATIDISYWQNQIVKNFVTYICTQNSIKDLEFELRCESEAIKYNQSLLEMFSKTCRANFGDNRCKVNLDDYSIICELVAISGNILTCDISGFENGYFIGGTVFVHNEKQGDYKFKILSHIANNIIIDISAEFHFAEQQEIKLIPACDKNFRTCCYSFNNAVNFTGEPAIPEYNIIKN